ncbi:MAG: carbohydrate kinase family protein, partial [Candidatus Heimdallarchaeota archaeon]|nr:carbohydrate kinase family protein [Candidatus Heimdallarchaeota archaeon]
MDIVSIGNLSIDSIKTPYTYIESVPGGATGAAACAASLNDSKVGVVSKVGQDFKEHLNNLSQYNIDLNGVKIVAGKTTRFDLTYNKDFDLIDIKEIWGKSTDLTPSDIQKEYLNSKCFHICPNSPVFHSLFLDLKKKDVLMSLDPHMLYKHEIAKKMLSKFHIITPNEDEAIAMTKEK